VARRSSESPGPHWQISEMTTLRPDGKFPLSAFSAVIRKQQLLSDRSWLDAIGVTFHISAII